MGAAIEASLSSFIFFVYSLGTRLTTVAHGCGQVFSYARDTTSSSEHSPVAHECSLQSSVHDLHENRRLFSMLSSVSAHDAALHDHGFLLEDSLDEYSIWCTRERTLFHSIRDSWNAMLPAMNRASGGKSQLQNKSRNFDSSRFSSYNAMTDASQKAITAMTQVGVKDLIPCKLKRRELPGAYHVRGTMPLLSNPLSSLDRKQGGFDSGTKPII